MKAAEHSRNGHLRMLDFWHPVLKSEALPVSRVVSVKVAGCAVAVFRTSAGGLGAIADQCAHRRMKLSVGKVQQDKLICAYHGWSFDCDGRGESPSAPKMHACVTSYDCNEATGVIWLKARGSSHELSAPAMEGWNFAGAVFNQLRAPLQLVIDNFSEIEHTVTTHPHFGFEPTRADQAVIESESGPDFITVRGYGPAKMTPLDTRLAVGLRRGDRFHADYTFRFDPPRSTVTHWWSDPRTGRERMFKYHVVHYFVPQDEKMTTMVTFPFSKIHGPLFRHAGPLVGWLFRRRTWETVEEDARLLENLADQSTSLEGMKLSRFDSILGMTRERLRRIYYDTPNGS
jgi:phenylpropionate dioxygenase-like ring-hydroxylating dioxygenase large terminal subunit